MADNIKTCQQCGASFHAGRYNASRRKFCSRDCKDTHAYQLRKPFLEVGKLDAAVECKRCHQPFVRRNAMQVYCSSMCRIAHKKERTSRTYVKANPTYWKGRRKQVYTSSRIARHEVRNEGMVVKSFPASAASFEIIAFAVECFLSTIHTVYSDGTERRWFDKIQKGV